MELELTLPPRYTPGRISKMPGSSLWLLPPANHPLNDILPTLIDKTSKQFNSPHRFLAHITLTSEISPSKYGSDPQAWLDSLSLPASKDVNIEFEPLESDEQCRQQVQSFEEGAKARSWAEEQYMPHLSLL
jgi:2',3'-cyclic-nucleotide 3'-phosphodiesterase